MKNFLISYLTQIATYATIIVIFTHNVLFDREVACTCQGQKFHCDLYISAPIFIIFLLLLWKDKVFNATFKAYCCVKKRRESQEKFSYLILIQMVKAAVISLLWVVSVLFDGDWYACCQNTLQGEEALIPCKKNRSLEEQKTIDDLKNKSKIYGLFTLLGLLILVVCFSLLKLSKRCKECLDWFKKHLNWCKKLSDCWKQCLSCFDCCKNCSECSNLNCSSCSECRKECSSCFNNCEDCLSYFDGDGPYELIIIQEEENVVNEILKERAKEALKQKVKDILEKDKTNKYMNCYNAAQQVIDQEWPEVNQDPGADVTAPPADQETRRNPGSVRAAEATISSFWMDECRGGALESSGLDQHCTSTEIYQGSSAGGAAPASDQPSGSEAETHEDVWKLTGNVSFTCSPGKKPSRSKKVNKAETHEDDWKLTGNVSFTRSPRKKTERHEDSEAMEEPEEEPLMSSSDGSRVWSRHKRIFKGRRCALL